MRLFRFSAVLMLLLVAVDTAAQTVSGSMSGVIVDGTGQVLPGADVAITHENSGEERRTVTNEIGAFAFPSLAPGPYTIRVTLTGFKPLEVKANIVQGNNRLAVGSLKLDIGEFNVSYAPNRRLAFSLSARAERRNSIEPLFNYDDAALNLEATWQFGRERS